MSETKLIEWEQVFMPLVEKWENIRCKHYVDGGCACESQAELCADELLVHLRTCGVMELLEEGQALCNGAIMPTMYKEAEAWDAAKAAMLAKIQPKGGK